MLYTPEEILEMASVYGSLSKIENGYGLIVESQISAIYDMDTSEAYMEGVSDVIETLIAHTTAIFKTIMEFISKQADKIDNLINGKKYEQLMTSEMKAKFDELSSGKPVMGIDAAKLYKLQKESEKFIEKFAVTVEGELARAANEPDYDNTKLKNYVDSAQKAYKMINDNIEKVGKTKIPLKKNDFYAMVKQGLNINTDMKSFKKKMAATQKNLTGVLRKLQKSKVLKESADDMLDIFTEGEGFFSKVKEGFMKAITAIKNFVMEHARIAQYVCMCLSVILGASSAVQYKTNKPKHEAYKKEISRLQDLMKIEPELELHGSLSLSGDRIRDVESLYKHWRSSMFNRTHSSDLVNDDASIQRHIWNNMFLKDPKIKKILKNVDIKPEKVQYDLVKGAQRNIKNMSNEYLDDKDKQKKTTIGAAAAGAAAIGFKALADANDRKKAKEKK